MKRQAFCLVFVIVGEAQLQTVDHATSKGSYSAESSKNNSYDGYQKNYWYAGRIANPFTKQPYQDQIGLSLSASKGFSCSGIDWRAVFSSYFSSKELQDQMSHVIHVIAEGAAGEGLHYLLQTYPSLAYVVQYYATSAQAKLSLDVQKCEVLENAIRNSVHDALMAKCVDEKVKSGITFERAQEVCASAGMSPSSLLAINLKLSDVVKGLFPNATGEGKTNILVSRDGNIDIYLPVEELTDEYQKAFEGRLKSGGSNSGVPAVDTISPSLFQLLEYTPPEVQENYKLAVSRFLGIVSLRDKFRQQEIKAQLSSDPDDLAAAKVAKASRELLDEELASYSTYINAQAILKSREKDLEEYVQALVKSRMRSIEAESTNASLKKMGKESEACCDK